MSECVVKPVALVTLWVDHMLGCDRCRRHSVRLARYEPAVRSELCCRGVQLMDAWLDEGVLPPRASSPSYAHVPPQGFRAR